MIPASRTVAALLTVLSLALGWVPRLHADTSFYANSGLIQRLYMSQDGRIYLALSNRPANAEDCGSGQYYFIPATHAQRDNIFDALLMSWTTGQVVKLRVTDAHVPNTSCEVAYVILDH